MFVLAGIIFHFLGGFASGSFYIPYKKVSGWSWETFWLVGGLFSWLIVPPLVAWLTVPGFADIILSASPSVLFVTYLFGLLWGIGGLTYGLGVKYLGVALGSTVILGLCAVLGAILPSCFYQFSPAAGHDQIEVYFNTSWGREIFLGIVICIFGIAICGIAGQRKEKEVSQLQTEHSAFSSYNFRKGILLAIVSGALSACFNFGLESGKEMAMAAEKSWITHHPGTTSFLFRNNVTYVVVLWGGLSSNAVCCLILNLKNRSFTQYTSKATPLLRNYLFCALAGTMWFLQFFFYGMGESRLGNSSSSWVLHMAFIILVANCWGIALSEWKQTRRATIRLLLLGISVIILSVIIVGLGNSVKH